MSNEKTKQEVLELVTQQKKAKIKWVASIAQISEDKVQAIAREIGLIIEDDYVLIPSEAKESDKVEDPIDALIIEAINNRTSKLSAVLKEDLDTLARVIIYRFSGDYSILSGKEVKNYIEYLQKRLRSASIENLRSYVPIAKYMKIYEIPLKKPELPKEEVEKIIIEMNKIEEQLKILSVKINKASILEKKGSKKGYNILLPDERIKNYSENDYDHIMTSLQLAYRAELRTTLYRLLEQGKIQSIFTMDIDAYNQTINYSRMLLETGKNRFANGFYKIASLYNSISLQLEPNVYEAILEESKALVFSNDFENGSRKLKEALKNNPKDVVLHCLLTILEILHGNKAIALNHLDSAKHIDSKNPYVNLAQGLIYAHDNDLENALQSLLNAYTKDESLTESIIPIEQTYRKLGKTQEAIDLLEKVSTKYSTNPFFKLKLGSLYELNGNDSKAYEIYQKVVRDYPRLPEALSKLGFIFLKMNKFKEANEPFSKLLDDDENNYQSLHGLSIVKKNLNEYAKASEYALASLKVKSDFIDSWENLAEIYEKMNNPKKAKEARDKIAKIAR